MLSVQTIQLLVTGLIAGGVIGFLSGIPYLKKKGINVDGIIDKAEQVVNVAGTTLDAVEPLLPPTIANNLEYIEKWAKIAVGKADQLYHAGDIGKDDRKTTEESVVDDLLKELNITPTESIKALINASILNAVNESGHKDPTEAEKQAKEQALQAQVAQLTTERDNLKNAITQFTATTASTVQATTQTA